VDGKGEGAEAAGRPGSTHAPSDAGSAEEAWDTVISPRHGWVPLNLRELWEHRELLYFLVWRNVKVRYTQTVFGAAWAVIPPVMTMVVFSVIFGRLVGLSSHGSPYALFSFCALVPWTYFSNAATKSGSSLVENERLLTKVYFPRLLVPLASSLAALLDFAIAFALLVVLMLGFGVVPSAKILAILPLVLLMVSAAVAVGVCVSALNVFYRDVHYLNTFLIQLLLFLSPVAYASSVVPDSWLPLYAINPMTGVIDGFRWALLEDAPAPGITIPIAIVSVAVLLIGGLFYFRRLEDSFADVV
jgi:lipopolysaccharide transport system permease protein